MLKKLISRLCLRGDFHGQVPDMNFLRRVAVKEAIINISTAVRYEPADLPPSESLKGDYVEFGVYQGGMFRFVCREAVNLMPWMRFVACDSFQGLPRPQGVDAGGEFVEGQFACSEPQFRKGLAECSIPLDRVITIAGWFSDSLRDSNVERFGIRTVSIAYVDCDLYESCVPVMSFLTPRLRQGSVVMFDDWFCFRSDPRKGVQRAVDEWLKENQQFQLIPWRAFSSHGFGFFVNIR